MRKPFDVLAEGLISKNSRETRRRLNFFWGHSWPGNRPNGSSQSPATRDETSTFKSEYRPKRCTKLVLDNKPVLLSNLLNPAHSRNVQGACPSAGTPDFAARVRCVIRSQHRIAAAVITALDVDRVERSVVSTAGLNLGHQVFRENQFYDRRDTSTLTDRKR